MKEFLSKMNYSIIGFIAFATRLAIFGASIGDAIALFAFAGLYGWQSWLKQQNIKQYNKQFENDVKIEFQKAAQEIVDMRATLGSLKLGSTMSTAFSKATHEQRR